MNGTGLGETFARLHGRMPFALIAMRAVQGRGSVGMPRWIGRSELCRGRSFDGNEDVFAWTTDDRKKRSTIEHKTHCQNLSRPLRKWIIDPISVMNQWKSLLVKGLNFASQMASSPARCPCSLVFHWRAEDAHSFKRSRLPHYRLSQLLSLFQTFYPMPLRFGSSALVVGTDECLRHASFPLVSE
jgi:hypothetical protein